MTYLYLDIETIPAQTMEARERIAGTVKPPAQMKKAETIAAWERDQKAAAVEEAIARSGLDGQFGHVCCISWAWDGEDAAALCIKDSSREVNLLSAFASAITSNRVPTVVGHNVVDFDIRFLWQRAIVNGVRLPGWFPRDPKPWDQFVFDTMTAWAGARNRISLDNLCQTLGIPGKEGIDGSMVGQMWADGRFDEIEEYCRADVERVRAIHRKMMVAYGEAA